MFQINIPVFFNTFFWTCGNAEYMFSLFKSTSGCIALRVFSIQFTFSLFFSLDHCYVNMSQNSTPVWVQAAIFLNSEKNRCHKTIWLHDVYEWLFFFFYHGGFVSIWGTVATIYLRLCIISGEAWKQEAEEQCLLEWRALSAHKSLGEAALLTNVQL